MCIYVSVGVEPIVCIEGKLHQLVSQTQHISREEETAELRVFFLRAGWPLLLSRPLLMKSSPKSLQIHNCCQWTHRPLPLHRPLPSVPKEKALSSPSLLRESGGGLRRRSQNEAAKDQRPHEESISHMSVPPSHAVGYSLNGQKEKMEEGVGGIPIDLFKLLGLT